MLILLFWEECIASIFRVKVLRTVSNTQIHRHVARKVFSQIHGSGSDRKKMALSGVRIWNQFLTLHTSTLKMEAICSSKMSVPTYKTTHCHSPNSTI
jgi:hypothetical protein